MRIKFIKEYKAFGDLDLPRKCVRTDYSPNEEVDAIDEVAQWLINNGFAEEVKESGWWKPKNGEPYYTVASDDSIMQLIWAERPYDKDRRAIGNVFKTRAAADRYVDYLKAVETVRNDEGFMPNVPKLSSVWAIGYNDAGVIAPMAARRGFAGSFRFYSYSQARDSLDKHRDEWQTILDYDWSRE